MFRWLFSLVILVLAIGGLLYFLAAYQVVRTEKGYAVWEKKDWEFSVPVLDTRDWNIADYIREGRISEAIPDIDLNKIKDFAKKSWRDVSRHWEDLDLKQASDQAQEGLQDLKREAKEKYDQLVEKWEKGEINGEQFQQKLEDLHAWTKQKIKELQAKLG